MTKKENGKELKSAPYNLKATRDSAISLLTPLHQLFLLTPERSENQEKNRKSRKAHGKLVASEKTVDEFHGNELN
jgi:hypothetical protein